ncbi:MAG: HPr family phosphocarrier protein [Pseudomonadota bacterium]
METSQRVAIVNKKGLHARASAAFARLAGAYSADISVRHNGEKANGEHIMDLLMLAAHKGTEIEIHAKGADAEAALSALIELVTNGFGELLQDQGGSAETGKDAGA